MRNTIIRGDALLVLRTLPSEYVQTIITSPPYYGLRDYNTPAQVWDGVPGCEHEWLMVVQKDEHGDNGMDGSSLKGGLQTQAQTRIDRISNFCRRCNAWRGSLGLEPTPDLYINHLVQIFREALRVLRKDGTLWLNIGDTYAGSGPNRQKNVRNLGEKVSVGKDTRGMYFGEIKPKDLMMIPARLALALQSDGWYVRQDIIWSKPNCMPESVTDRPTKAHEYIFLLSKSERYYYDAHAITEPTIYRETRNGRVGAYQNRAIFARGDGTTPTGTASRDVSTRNKRSVWTVATQPYSEAHFATFPPKLIEPCILAGTSPRACEHCGAPWGRVTAREPMVIRNGPKAGGYGSRTTDGLSGTMLSPSRAVTTGWQPTCPCTQEGTGKCIVLDPFFGSGTVGEVANRFGRNWLGIELNPEYIKLAEIRTAQQGLWTPESEAV